MLNPALPLPDDIKQLSRYVLEGSLAQKLFESNASLSSHEQEWRLQDVYGEELWIKLLSLHLPHIDWSQCDILDVCAGTGFLSFHLLKRVRPRSLTVLDANSGELEESKKLLERCYPNLPVKYMKADLLQSGLPSSSFDIALGNSFLHHLCDMPHAVRELKRLVKPGGILAALHEPTPGAIAYESGRWDLVAKFWTMGSQYIEDLRKQPPIDLSGCVDVWLLESERLREVFEDEGFEHVVMRGFNIVRPFVIAAGQLHLHREKPRLSRLETLAMRWAILTDRILQHVLPLRLFGSLALCARKGVRL